MPIIKSLTVDLTFYFACCRDGTARESSTTSNSTKRRAKRESRKINAVCISRMYVTLKASGTVVVNYISSHTNHDLSLAQVKFLPLPKDTKDSIAIKLTLGIPIDRIMDGTSKHYSTCTYTYVHDITTTPLVIHTYVWA